MIGIHELQVFMAAAEMENFSAAARKLHLSQPAISFQIQALEEQLKVKLFQRNGRRISLTEAGRDLLPMAREAICLSERIEETMCSNQGIVRGHILIGCSTSPGKYVLPHLIGAFRKRYPETRFSVDVMDRQSVEDRLIAKELDVGILGVPSKNKDLECWPFFDDEFILIAAAQHPWARRGQVELEELKDAEWIWREAGSPTRQLVQVYLAEFGVDARDLPVAMELGSPEAVETAVEAGHGVSFVSRVAVRRGLETGAIKQVTVDGLEIRRQIYLARNRHHTCTFAQQCFREFIESPEGQAIIQLTI